MSGGPARICSTSERPTAVLADIDPRRGEGAVRLLGCRQDGELLAGLEIALAADLIAHDVRVGRHDDPLLAFLVLHDEARLPAGTRRCGDRTGWLDRAVGHG